MDGLDEIFGDYEHVTDGLLIDEVDETIKGRPSLEKHLDSPISLALIDRIMNCIECLRSIMLETPGITWLQALEVHKTRDSDYYYSGLKRIMHEFILNGQVDGTLSKLRPKEYPGMFSIGWRDRRDLHLIELTEMANIASREGIDSYLTWIKDVVKPTEYKRLEAKLTLKTLTLETMATYGRYKFWSRVVNVFRKHYTEETSHIVTDFRYFTMQVFDRFALIKIKGPDIIEQKLVTFEQLQMIQDVCYSRFNLSLALDHEWHNGTPQLRSHVTTQIKWQEACIMTYSSKGYDLAKAPEALCKTLLTKRTGGDVLELSSFDRTVEKIRCKERALSDSGLSPLVDSYSQYIEKIESLKDLVELFGLIKISGHPVVIAKESARAVREKGTAILKCGPWSIYQQTRIFKHLILSGYLSRHSDWPPMRQGPRPGSLLYRLWQSRATVLTMDCYELSELDCIRFGKFVQFDYSRDFLKFLDDKAVGVGAAEASSFWFGNEKKENSRRLLLQILKTEEFDLFKLVERFRQGTFTVDELIVELTQKEREMKPWTARCFCKLPLTVRTFFTLIEYNLSEQVMKPYLPQQSMTMSDSELKKRLHRMAFGTTKRNTCVVETDFSTWNTAMRETPVNMISRQLEDLFGLPGVYSQAHPFFTAATIVLTEKHCKPEGVTPGLHASLWPESDLVWRGHLGGFEGIQQKLWTIFTITLVYYALFGLGVSFILTGQGDNHVLLLSFKKEEDMRDVLPRVLSNLEYYSELVGQVVKPDECIDSRTVLTYSKEIYIKGVHYQYSLKFLCRTFSRNDSDIPSSSAEVSNISGSSIMAAATLPLPLTAWLWQNIHVLLYLQEEAEWADNNSVRLILREMRSDFRLLKFMIMLPASLGGLPCAPWSRFLVKGEVDPLSWDLAALLRSENMDGRRHIQLLLDGDGMSRNPDITQLMSDPYSIPIIRPRDQTRIIKDTIKEQIPGLIKNRWLREIFCLTTSLKGEKLKEILCSTNPFYPTIMADIFKASPAGVQDDLYSRFIMTRTIKDVTNSKRFVHTIKEASYALLLHIHNRYIRVIEYVSKPSLYVGRVQEYADQLRGFWSVENKVVGTALCPLSRQLTTNFMERPCIIATCRSVPSEMMTTVGKYPPNFGTFTRQKKSDYGFKIIKSEATLHQLIDLVTTASQIGNDPNLSRIIDEIIRTRSPWTLDSCKNIFPTTYGGIAAHRHSSLTKQFFGILGNCTVPTHLNFCSDRSGALSGGLYDYAEVFQLDYLLLTSILQTYSIVCDPDVRSIGIGLVVDESVMSPIDTSAVTLRSSPSEYLRSGWGISTNNPLIFVNKMELQHIPLMPATADVPVLRSHQLTPAAIYCGSLYSETISSIVRASSDSTPHASGLRPVERLDIAEYRALPLYAATLSIARVAKTLTLSGIKREIIDKIIINEAGSLSRYMLTPIGQASDMAQEIGVYGMPGERYNMAATRRVTNYIGRIYDRIDPVECMRGMRPVMIFPDSPHCGANIVYITSHAWIRTASGIAKSKRVMTIAAEFIRGLKRIRTEPSLIDILKINYYIRHTRIALNKVSEVVVAEKRPLIDRLVSSWPPFRQYTKDRIEFQRLLRVTEGKTGSAQHYPRVVRSQHPRPCVAINTLEMGELMTEEELFLNNLRYRSDGISTTAMSTWVPVADILTRRLRRDKKQISSALTVGVGRGASSASLGLSGFTVTGIDLLQDIPANVQREFSSCPPEVVLQGVAASFSWHSLVWQGGDWMTHDRKDLISRGGYSVVVIDIESGLRGSVHTVHCDQELWRSCPKLEVVVERTFMDTTDILKAMRRGYEVFIPYHPGGLVTPGIRRAVITYMSRNMYDLRSVNKERDQHLTQVSCPIWPTDSHIRYPNLLRVMRLHFLALDQGVDPPVIGKDSIKEFLTKYRKTPIKTTYLYRAIEEFHKVEYENFPLLRRRDADYRARIRAMCYLMPHKCGERR